MQVRPIRTADEHQQALQEVAQLMPKQDQESIDRLEVLQALIERWERDNFAFEGPTPAAEIRYRMDQLDLKPRDLLPYLGTKSRVSEILAGLRQPTVDQIRALHRHLEIPVHSLIGETKHEPALRPSTASKAAVEKLKSLGVMKRREHIDAFVARAQQTAPALAMLRKSRTDRTNAKTDLGALEAWCAGVLVKAEERRLPRTGRLHVDLAFARELAHLSVQVDGPLRARAALANAGVILVTLDHLPGTFLDGAVIRRSDGAPVIALTLRYDRLDNFWFTLMHEVGHVSEHLGSAAEVILDDLDVNSSSGIEAEADLFARNALIPPEIWERYDDPALPTEGLLELAREASVHPGIAAGRWRWEHGDYRKFTKFLGSGQVRGLFVK